MTALASADDGRDRCVPAQHQHDVRGVKAFKVGFDVLPGEYIALPASRSGRARSSRSSPSIGRNGAINTAIRPIHICRR